MTDHTPSTHVAPGAVRIGDRERADAAERLSAHAAAGRLGIDELEQRLERAGAAVFARDLDALEADLPGPPAPRPAWRPPPFALAAVLVAAALAATVATGHPIVPLFLVAWFVWRRAAWGGGAWGRGAYLAPGRWPR